MRQTKHRGIARVAAFPLNLIAYNLIRIPELLAPSHPRQGYAQHQTRNYIQLHRAAQ